MNGVDTLRKAIEEVLTRPLVDLAPLEIALTHRSYVNETTGEDGPLPDNERLEFLGDSVLNLAVSHMLMDHYPGSPEGALSKFRSAIVNERSLALAARAMELGRFLRLGKGEEQSLGRDKDSILANTFEAVVAAVYLANGYADAQAFVAHHMFGAVIGVSTDAGYQDYKTALQEYTQRMLKATPIYRLASESGPDHDKMFESEVLVNNKVYGRGVAKSKKDSEQKGALEALRALEQELGEGEAREE